MTLRLLAAIFLTLPAAAQTTWYVDAAAAGPGTGAMNDPYPEIQDAIAAPATVDGDVVQVAPGTYHEIDFGGKTLAVRSTGGALVTTIDGALGPLGPVVTATGGSGAGTSVEGFRLTGGHGAPAGAGSGGGGALVIGSQLLLEDCVITDCHAGATAVNRGGGAAAFFGATLRISRTTIERCEGDSGGGIFGFDSIVIVEDSIVQNNPTQFGFIAAGGGIEIENGTLEVRGSEILGNHAARGAGVMVNSGVATFERTTFANNTEPMGCIRGGAINGSGTISDCLFENNRAQFGGALYGAFTVTDSTFRGNSFDQSDASFGGAVYASAQGSIALDGCLLEGNACYGQGGAAHGATLTSCTVRGNRANADPCNFEDGLGGGLFDCDATDCVIEDNVAVEFGGGFVVARGGGAHGGTLLRCVLIGNQAEFGGGAARTSLEQCTVWRNSSTFPGGGLSGASSATSSVFWRNSPDSLGDDGSGLPTVVWSDIEGVAPAGSNIEVDPFVWGPWSGDVHLRAGSPCIDAGDPALFDPDGSRADMGAVPFDATYVGAPGNYCRGKTTSEGCIAASSSTGAPSISAGSFEVQATLIPAGTLGLVFLARAGDDRPYLFGRLCIGGALLRTPPINATGSGVCGGNLARTFAPADLAALGFAAGERLYAQWIFRDAAQADGTGLGMTDGVEAVVLP